MEADYDVVIAGGSIAGCAAAMFYGRAGLRVAVLERNRDIASFKAMCGHFILGGTYATLDRLDLLQPLCDAGAELCSASVYAGAGWIERDASVVPPAVGLRRKELDPLLRRVAAATPGVDLVLGARVTGIVRDDAGRVAGVGVGDDTITARLVIGADGHRSPIASFAGLGETTMPNPHFFWWAYYAGLDRAAGTGQIWKMGDDTGVAIPAGNGLTLVGAFPMKARLAEFAQDRIAALESFVAALPDAPRLDVGERVSPAIGTSDYPFIKRDPIAPGLALIGDAAMAADPLPAVGCGWAFRSAEWLADATIPALRDGGDVDATLPTYRASRAFAEAYDDMTVNPVPTPEQLAVQQLIAAAAVRDTEIARRLGMFAMRAAPASDLINADTIARAKQVLQAA